MSPTKKSCLSLTPLLFYRPQHRAWRKTHRPPTSLTNEVRPAQDVLCGGAIEPFLYATDIFIPLLDLNQETRCMIRPIDAVSTSLKPTILNTSETSNSQRSGRIITWLEQLTHYASHHFTDNIRVWHWMRSVYSLLGWVMISLFVFTLTNQLHSDDANT